MVTRKVLLTTLEDRKNDIAYKIDDVPPALAQEGVNLKHCYILARCSPGVLEPYISSLGRKS